MAQLAMLIPIVAIVLGISAGIFSSYLEHKRKMKLIEIGAWTPEMEKKESKPEDMLKGGIIVTAIGLAVSLQLTIGMGPWHAAGFVLFFVGIALIIAYYVTRK
ncbi:MAG: DUF6249 domain-containing protein [Candidatus Bathyarchaeia archaeon]